MMCMMRAEITICCIFLMTNHKVCIIIPNVGDMIMKNNSASDQIAAKTYKNDMGSLILSHIKSGENSNEVP